MAFVGREGELSRAERLLSSGSAGVITGPSGIGKTALLAEIARRYDETPVLIPRNERTVPFSGLSAIAAALGGERGEAIDRALLTVDEARDFEIAGEISRALHRAGGEGRMLFIDDLDDIDPSSARVLSYVLSRIHGTGLAVIATAVRIEESSPFGGLTQIALGPLGPHDSAALVGQLLGTAAAPGVVQIVARFSGGHPWAIRRATLTAYEQVGATPVPLPLRIAITSDERHRLEAYLRAVEAEALLLLDLLALAPLTSRTVLLQLAGDRPHLVEELLDRGLVERRHDLLRIADPALRIALYARTDVQERARLHAWAARAHHGVDRAITTWHESFAGDVVDDEDALLSVAEAFVRDDDVDTAVEFAERGLRDRHGTAARNGLLLHLADTLWRFGHFALAALYRGRVTAFDRPGLRLADGLLALRLADATQHTVDDAVVDAYLAENLAADPAGCGRLLAETARIRLRRAEPARALQRITAAIALHPTATPLEYELIRDAARVGGRLDGGIVGSAAEGCVAAAAQPGSLVGLGAGELVPLLSYLTYTEQHDLCRSLAAMFLERLRPAEPVWMEQVHFRVAINEMYAGDAAGLRDAVVRWQASRSAEAVDDAVAMILLVGVAEISPRADDSELEGLISRGRQRCLDEHNTGLQATFDAAEGRLALAAGRYEEAIALLDRAARGGIGDDDPAALRAEGDLIAALWESGRRKEASERSRQLAAFATTRSAAWLTRAAERARALCAPGDPGSATVHDTEVLTVSESVRVAPTSTGTAGSAPTALLDRSPLSRLTPEEQEVARLVNLGMRNREIAAELFVSLRTVELRLTRIYRKLGVRSRSHLVAVLVGD